MAVSPGPKLSSHHSGTWSSRHPRQQLPTHPPPPRGDKGRGKEGQAGHVQTCSSQTPQLQQLDLFLAGGFPAGF